MILEKLNLEIRGRKSTFLGFSRFLEKLDLKNQKSNYVTGLCWIFREVESLIKNK